MAWLLDVPEFDTASSHVLELHERLGILQLTVGHLMEILGESSKGHVITIKVVGLCVCVWGGGGGGGGMIRFL